MKTAILLLIGLVAVSADVFYTYSYYASDDCSGSPSVTNEKGTCQANVPTVGQSLKYGELDKCKENHKIKTTMYNNAECTGTGQPYNKPVAVPKKNSGECVKGGSYGENAGSGAFTCAGFASASMNVFNAFVVVAAITCANL